MDDKGHLEVAIAEYRLIKDLLRMAKLTRAYVDLAVRDAGLVIGQDDMIAILSEDQPQIITVIAKRLGVKPPTASNMVHLLEAKGFVKRVAYSRDRRRMGVVLTSSGAGLQRSVEEIRLRLERELLRNLRPAEIGTIHQSLELIDGQLKQRTGRSGA
ncbi:MarR family transcriptional regulator [Aurantimonas sp. A2-1-M11]|uniref:MarR family winged helix-turn-helix transcriptional regulator n=1 Tax=Aurantimonas sp. A2-1-M11 TaxID=3113712 RepID=UPI002F925985